jgi:hypothetical protein
MINILLYKLKIPKINFDTFTQFYGFTFNKYPIVRYSINFYCLKLTNIYWSEFIFLIFRLIELYE